MACSGDPEILPGRPRASRTGEGAGAGGADAARHTRAGHCRATAPNRRHGGAGFHPGAVHRINIDSDGDLQTDAAFSFTFSEPQDGRQTATAYYATGAEARQPEPAGQVLIAGTPVGTDATAQPVQVDGPDGPDGSGGPGPVRLFIGIPSDPFFADAEGALHGLVWTGNDTFAGTNIMSIALEVPNDMLGAAPQIGVWATVSLRRDGTLVQMDRGGHLSINPSLPATPTAVPSPTASSTPGLPS